MTDIERIITMFAEAIAQTAETCAAGLDDSGSTMSGAQALRNFAASIRENNGDFIERKNAVFH